MNRELADILKGHGADYVEIRLEEIAGGTKVILRHRAIGFLEPAHRQGVGAGWQSCLDSLRKDFS